MQAVMLLAIAADWVEASNVSEECGYDGTCIDDGLVGVTGALELAVVVVEVLAGVLWWGYPLWRRRLVPQVDDWWALVALRLPVAVMAGCAGSVMVAIGWRLFG
ncbi:hypothetical protein [Kitasatospora sp. MMS16-BH015]|uniref:hypothetical protein n=1 Tax=Kitasatospora sp. MMS16-BH015 TaxID=2018025 RepID=UPI00131A4C2B|nr:hypothetical protein [Kitasatospora sp. MMS16-BH015]